MSCSVGAFNAAYHTKMGVYHREMGIEKGGTGFDDVFCYAPVAAVVELCSAVLSRDYAQSVKASGRQKRCCNSEKTLSVVGQIGFLWGLKSDIRLIRRYGGSICILPLANRNKNF